jgi:hypothetical protein
VQKKKWFLRSEGQNDDALVKSSFKSLIGLIDAVIDDVLDCTKLLVNKNRAVTLSGPNDPPSVYLASYPPPLAHTLLLHYSNNIICFACRTRSAAKAYGVCEARYPEGVSLG